MIPFDIELINNRLLDKYGKTFEGLPRYRVVWADGQTEHRKVEYENGQKLVWPKILEVKKYPYLKLMWVLESWVYGSPSSSEVVTTYGGCYEPVWSFRDKDNNPLRPNWKVVELLCEAAQVGIEKKSDKQLRAENEAAFNKEVAEFEDMLIQEGTDYGNQTDAFVKPVGFGGVKQDYRDF